jgi:hypothetical protein
VRLGGIEAHRERRPAVHAHGFGRARGIALAERAVDEPLGAEHLDRRHEHRPARAGAEAGAAATLHGDVLGSHTEDQLAVARRRRGEEEARAADAEGAALRRSLDEVHRRRADEAATKVVAGRE